MNTISTGMRLLQDLRRSLLEPPTQLRPRTSPPAKAAAEVTRLAGAAAASVAGGAGLEAAERAIRAGLLRLGASVLEDLLTADAGYAGPRLDCGTGHLAVFTGYRDKNADTVLGPVTIARAWYHCAACGHGFAPRDAQLGVAGETMSPGLRKMTARAAAAVPFAAGARLVGELAGISLTGKRTGRRAEADGNAAAAVIEAEAAAITARAVLPLPAGPLPGKLYVAIDGTGVPMTAAGTEGRPGKGEDGRARTREVKMAAAFTQTTVDEHGYPVRDPGSSSYLATLAAAPQFGILMAAEARRRGAGHIRQLTILGDGAPWIWNLASQHFPEATQIVDLFHAREHVHDLANLAGLLAGHRDEWLGERLAELDAGDIGALSQKTSPGLSGPPRSLTHQAEPRPAVPRMEGAGEVLPEPPDRRRSSASADTSRLRRDGGEFRVGCGVRGGLHRLPEPPGPARLRPVGDAGRDGGRHITHPAGHHGDAAGPPPPLEAGPRNRDARPPVQRTADPGPSPRKPTSGRGPPSWMRRWTC